MPERQTSILPTGIEEQPFYGACGEPEDACGQRTGRHYLEDKSSQRFRRQYLPDVS